jgi:DNA invertase Pin-like site-specific DNA recombinase
MEIAAAGFTVNPRRIVVEFISGGAAASARSEFSTLIDRLEADDILIVTKLDRLGRNAMDLRARFSAWPRKVSGFTASPWAIWISPVPLAR